MTRNSLRGRFDARAALKSLYAAAALAVPVSGSAAPVPGDVAPGAPFPAVRSSDIERETVAPGVVRATYRMLTAAGPLVFSVLLVDPREPTVRIGAVLAHDTVVSKDETTSSMARRTGAVAGVNGDYFDINASGAPLGIVVRDGELERSPSTRPALVVGRDRTVGFATFRFAGSVTSGGTTVPITGVNEWPPDAGASLLTPSFGAIPAPATDATVLDLAPLRSCCAAGAPYRVTAVTAEPPWPAAPALRLAYGASARAAGPLPDVGDVVTPAYDTDPSLAGVAAAVGGGPMLVQDGRPVDDPASPNYAERDRRIPATAAARLGDGTLALVVVDGRRPATSIGVNRAELIALLRALGATDAMLFDSGGSATMAARVLGDVQPSVVNEPSDGAERPVADGLFVYSDAPVGAPSRLVLRPSRVVALRGARVALLSRLVDANGHGLGDARGAWHVAASPLVAAIDAAGVMHAGAQAGSGAVAIARDGVRALLPVEVVDRVARLAIGPDRANPEPHGALDLTVQAFDAHDRPVATSGVERWSARGATIDRTGRLVAGDRDALVTASVGGITATVTVPVGRHAVPIAFAESRAWQLVTAPPSGPGAVRVDDATLRIAYDFTAGERAAYAVHAVALGTPLSLGCAIDGDASGVAVRATLEDRYGDRATLTLARSVDFSATRRVVATVPAWLAPPVALRNVYVVGTLANPPIAASGTIGVHDCVEVVPGAQPERSSDQARPATNAAMPIPSAHTGGAAAIASAG